MRKLSVGCFLLVAACASSGDPSATEARSTGVAGLLAVQTPLGPVPCASARAGYVCPRATRGFAISPAPVVLKGKSTDEIIRIGYGSYVVNAMSDCAACHSSPAGYLAGGNPFALDAAGHVVFARNLTPDPATGLALTQDQFVESMRTGHDFHPGASAMLVVMPWPFYRWASDGDLAAIYSYLKAIPAAANPVPEDNKAGLGLPPEIPFTGIYDEGDVPRPLPADDGSLMANLERGLAIQPLADPRDSGNANEFARGSYLANSLSECGACHTQGAPGASIGRDARLHLATDHYMTGGNVFKVPPPLQPMLHQTRTMSANLTGATYGFFHEADVDYDLFARIILTMSHADENPPRPLGFPMPAQELRNLLDDDLRSIFTYAKHVTPNTSSDLKRQDYARWCATSADCNAGETCHADADPLVGNECVGKACLVDSDCDACQTCFCNTCTAPKADSACIQNSF
jgi:mono/diheme cytochrome c family protein